MSHPGDQGGEVRRLAAYFRQHPAALDEAPESIAQATGASVATVRALLAEREPVDRQRVKSSVHSLIDAARDVVHAFDRLLKYPMLFIGITFALTLLAWQVLPSPRASAANGSLMFTIEQAAQVAVFGMMLLLHMAAYFRIGMVRYAIMGGGLVAATSFALLSVQILTSDRIAARIGLPAILALLALGMIVLGALYAGLGIGASLLGAYRRLRREELAKRKRTRQELLQRLFEVEEALAQSENETPDQPRLIDLFRGIAGRVWWYALGGGVFWSLILGVLTLAFPGMLDQGSARSGSIYTPFIAITVSAGSMATQIFLAYLTGRPSRAVLASWLYTTGGLVVNLLPIGAFGTRYIVENQANIIASYILATLTGLFAGLGAMVEERAYLARRRGQNAPEMLLTEMIELRRLLNRGEQHRCVMVVDAARSSVMKAKSDPLVAEWSFRAYQEFLTGEVTKHGGRIHSTAGDGAIAVFEDAENAFSCARSIQTNISEFNQSVNRLKDPFRLRIGLHCGVVSGELEEVQFAAVIDIAAHIEAASQVGGIAVTAAVAEQLPNHRFAEISDTVDEQRVLLALNPTLDPEDDC